MSTICRFRKQSGAQFIDTMRELVNHTSFYINRMPKSTRFLWQTRVCGIVQDALIAVVRGNSVQVITDGDYAFRRKLRKMFEMERDGRISVESIRQVFTTVYGSLGRFDAHFTRMNYLSLYLRLMSERTLAIADGAR